MFKESLLLIWRSHLVALGGVLFFLIVLAAFCAGLFSGRQPATVALDVGISVLRLSIPLFVFLLVHEAISREFSCKYYLRTLAMPVCRSKVLLGKLSAVLFFVFVLVLFASASLSVVAYFVASGYAQATSISLSGLVVSSAFLLIDVLVILSLAVFVSVLTSSTGFLFISICGFSVISRSFRSVIELLAEGAPLESGLSALSWIIPDLGSLDMREIALYGKIDFLPENWLWLVISNLGYVICFLALAVWALQHKRFN